MGKKKLGRIKYRITILNDNTLDTAYTARISRPKVIAAVIGIVAVICTLFFFILYATPIRNVLPGYLDPRLKQQMLNDAFRLDSLEDQMGRQEAYMALVRSMVSGRYVMDTTVSMDTLAARQIALMEASREELDFRSQYEEQEKFNIQAVNRKIPTEGLLFYRPLTGAIDSLFNEQAEHYGIDIAAARRQPVLAVLDGTVIFAGYTPADEYVVMVQHNTDFVSVYRQMSSLLKSTGEKVNAGEAIAFVGPDAGQKGRPHLHFELWYKGKALNPVDYIVF